MANIAIIDDDLSMNLMRDNLSNRGHNALWISSVDEALKKIDKLVSVDLIVLDIIMPWPKKVKKQGLEGDHNSGMVVYREIRSLKPNLPILVFSATQDDSIIDIFLQDPATTFMPKWDSPKVNDFISNVYSILELEETPIHPTPFIVHGQNKTAKLDLKNFLQNSLNLPEPIILHEKPNQGLTIIEKFEEYAARSSIVFVLLTPDDIGGKAGDSNKVKRRARQNVIFEMGYFLGMLGRKSGRVILLYHGDLEIPSDIFGVIYIDIRNGIMSAGEEIRKEVEKLYD